MFEWSKELCDKIADSYCLEPKEMQMVEIALRLYECYGEILILLQKRKKISFN